MNQLPLGSASVSPKLSEKLSEIPSETAAAQQMELVCPAGSLPALKAAVDNGADCVYLGFRDATNARNFAGLNFDEAAIAEGIRYAHAKRSEEHTSELQSLMRISYAVFCLKKKNISTTTTKHHTHVKM